MAEPRINGICRVMDGNTNLRTLKEINTLLTKLNNQKPSIITCFLSGRPTYTSTSGQEWTKLKISLNTMQSVGSNLVLSNGGIKANKAMKALVSAQIIHWMPTATSDEFDISISRNTLDVSGVVLESHGNMLANLDHHLISPSVVTLNSGDTLYLGVVPGAITSWKAIGDNHATYMTVQELIT